MRIIVMMMMKTRERKKRKENILGRVFFFFFFFLLCCSNRTRRAYMSLLDRIHRYINDNIRLLLSTIINFSWRQSCVQSENKPL